MRIMCAKQIRERMIIRFKTCTPKLLTWLRWISIDRLKQKLLEQEISNGLEMRKKMK